MHAFEVNPVAIGDLEKNIQQNTLSPRVTVHQKAVSDRGEEIPFVVRSDSTGNTLQTITVDERDSETITVESVNLGDFIRESDLPRPTIMKIDIEGAEVNALKSMKTSLEDCRLVYCEVHENVIEDTDSVLPAALFRDRGFDEIAQTSNYSSSQMIPHGQRTAGILIIRRYMYQLNMIHLRLRTYTS